MCKKIIKKGFTIVETMVTMVIFLLLCIATYAALHLGTGTFTKDIKYTNLKENAETVADVISNELRQAIGTPSIKVISHAQNTPGTISNNIEFYEPNFNNFDPIDCVTRTNMKHYLKIKYYTIPATGGIVYRDETNYLDPSKSQIGAPFAQIDNGFLSIKAVTNSEISYNLFITATQGASNYTASRVVVLPSN